MNIRPRLSGVRLLLLSAPCCWPGVQRCLVSLGQVYRHLTGLAVVAVCR